MSTRLIEHEKDLIKKVFFMAMMDGYANASPQKFKLGELPGSRLIVFEHEEDGHSFYVSDLYFVTDSDSSCGVTIISLDGKPVWRMSYEGEYSENLIPGLKLALKYSYSRGNFFGGRGPMSYKISESLMYINNLNGGSFANFSGEEKIVSKASGQVLGWHNYRGGLMV